ncbi:MAG TPA: 50S ribosomal protein L15 [Candidatus Baltobacteraceae bacterium]|jgi:large subunit ribosomal protein L15|nr:50S ribosomal protein L15 [Candidatus Baltobacteraceae bacterium]
MAEKKASTKKPASGKSTAKAGSKKPAAKAKPAVSSAAIASGNGSGLTLGQIKPAHGSWPKRTRVGRGHGSGMVKTGGEGGKGQTVRSGGGKGPAFEGGQTPWQRRLPHRRGYSQKARDIGHFRTQMTVVNLHDLADWDPSVEVTPQTLKVAKKIKNERDGVKILGGSKAGKTVPSGLRFRDVLFSNSAREALTAAGATLEEAVSAGSASEAQGENVSA